MPTPWAAPQEAPTVQPRPGAPVFVDESGIRGRALRGLGWVLGLGSAFFGAAMASSLVGAQSQAPVLRLPPTVATPALTAPAAAAPSPTPTSTAPATAPAHSPTAAATTRQTAPAAGRTATTKATATATAKATAHAPTHPGKPTSSAAHH